MIMNERANIIASPKFLKTRARKKTSLREDTEVNCGWRWKGKSPGEKRAYTISFAYLNDCGFVMKRSWILPKKAYKNYLKSKCI